MIPKFRRFLKSREARKLRRDKGAMVALVVIGAYVMIALAVMCNLISKQDCAMVVGPNSMPGFFLEESPERRFEIARTSMLRPVQRALGRSEPEAALADVKLGRWHVSDKSLDELQTIVDQAVVMKQELDKSENLDTDSVSPNNEPVGRVSTTVASMYIKDLSSLSFISTT